MTICLILRNLVNLSQIEDLDVNSAHYIFEGGGMKKFWKFPDMTHFRGWADCQWATWQHNFRWELRQWVRNHTELEWWPSWTIPGIFWDVSISPKCRNFESRNNSVMHQSEMEVYQIFFHQSILRRLMKKWYIHHLFELSLCSDSRKPTSAKMLVRSWIRSPVKIHRSLLVLKWN